MKFCKNCIMPDTKPDQIFDENGICSVCVNYEENKKKINWNERANQFKNIK